jgi:glycosyltransferase involved in cell wall biosynthesis
MARGMVLLIANGGGHPEQVVDGENGLLFAPKSAESAANAVCRILHDLPFAEQLAQKSYQRVQRYTWENVADELEKLFMSELVKKQVRCN